MKRTSIIRYDRRDWDSAIADHSRAIELEPRLVESWNNRANARRAKGDLDGAIADYDRALELNPGYALCYANRGVAWLMKGSIIEAENDFNQCRELAGHLPPHVVQRINELKTQVVGKRRGN
jgi:tetratricopeptide (TPR) repeat protein